VSAVGSTPVGSYALSGSGGLGSTSGDFGAPGSGGGALPPVHPPSDPSSAGSHGLQNFFLNDVGILSQIQSLSSNEALKVVINAIVVGSNVVNAQGSVSNVESLNGIVCGNAILSAQDFIGSSSSLNFIEPY